MTTTTRTSHRVVVTDMHCASCATAVEKGLRRLPGVVEAELTFATERCDLVYDPAITDLKAIKARIVQMGYGALEEGELAQREEAHVRDLRLQWRRLVWAWLLGTPIFVLMVADWVGLGTVMPGERLMMFAFATPLIATVGLPYYRGAWQALRYGHSATTDVLIALGFSAAYLYSVVAFFAGRPTYFDTSAMVLTFVTTGKYLKVRATATSSQAVRRLVGLQARTAEIVDQTGATREVPIDDVEVGDRLLIRPGARIPLDGSVTVGQSLVDESMLTGESFPLTKKPGDRVLAGTLNQSQLLRIRVEKIGRETTLAGIITLLDSTQSGKPAVLELSDRISAVFVPGVLVISAATFTVWMVLGAGAGGGVGAALAHAVAVLVIACPCAVSLAPGTAIAVATGEAAHRGCLIKGPTVLEDLQRARVVVFDKTGTLTHGRPTVTNLVLHPGWGREDVLRYAAAAEASSEHPLAAAITQAATDLGLPVPPATTSQTVPGRGVRALVDGHHVVVGSPRLINEATDGTATWEIASDGHISVGVAVDGRFAATLWLADPIRPEAPAVVAHLQARGTRVVMLTGDHHATAAAVAEEVGIDEVRAEVLPGGKVEVVRDLQTDDTCDGKDTGGSAGVIVAMVGDGLNDAAALAQADIGIALGTGTDVAAEASDLTLLREDLTGVIDTITLSRRAYRVIVQNFVYAFAFNGIGLPIAAAGMLNPVFAALSMGISSVAVVTNSLRLRGSRIEEIQESRRT